MLRRRNQGQSPCSACKVLRKGCQGNCELAECFPISRLDAYKQAHALFGSAHIKKIVKAVCPEKMKEAAESVLLEAEFWKRSPREGCLGVILDLYEKIIFYERTLVLANRLLRKYRLFVDVWIMPIGDGDSPSEQEEFSNDFDLNVTPDCSTVSGNPASEN
ncbi:hypothetical protein MLD38_005821 [Melastoma candidum]|uniref:Uncharacterized protein n=1 Tax=Melastoma candidum TaxID=119954 RepID=A0ACB9RKW3_9MYRT|nr:hypothetical protein MLD38_005821 [Melastoma candidum]